MKSVPAIALLPLAMLPLAAAPLAAQVVVLNGPSTIGSDSNSGRLLQIVSKNSGGARVSISTTPAVAFVCDEKTPATTCMAWVKADARIVVTLRRPGSVRTPPGQGTAPAPRQWGADCAGTRTPDCAVTMRANRTVLVDWGR